MTAPDIFRYARFGAETTFHTVANATFGIETTSNGLDSPENQEIIIDSGCGRGPRTKVPGYYTCQGPIEYYPDIETIGWFWRWFLTGYQYTAGDGTPDPNLHEIYGTSSGALKSVTVREGRDNWEQIFAGGMLNTIDLRVDTSAQLGSCSLGWITGKDTPGAICAEADLNLPSDSLPLGFAESRVWIDEEENSALMKSMVISGTNNIAAESAQRFNSLFPQGGFLPGKRGINFALRVVFEDRTHKNIFWGSDAGPATTGSLEVPISFKLSDPDGYRSILFCAPRTLIRSVKSATRGSDPLVQDIAGTALIANNVALADGSLVNTELLVTLNNYQATMI